MTTHSPADGACPVCQATVATGPRPRGGRQSLYCSASCKARAYRSRLAAATRRTTAAAVPDGPDARHAAALTAHQALTRYAAALADIASGQQALLPAAGPADPAVLAAASHDLIDLLAALAAATQQTSRDVTQPQRPPRRQRAAATPPLFSPDRRKRDETLMATAETAAARTPHRTRQHAIGPL